MNWDAIGAIGEIVGALAVVASLGYLAVQIRAQNRESRAAATHEISLGFRESVANFLDQGLVDIFLAYAEDPDSLSDGDNLRLIIGLQSIFRVWEEAFYQYQDGRLDDRIWQTMTSQYSMFLSAPAFNMAWSLRKQHFDPSFRDFVDGLEAKEYKIR